MANLDRIPEVDILAEINRLILKHGEKKVKETLRLYLGEIINSTQPSIVTETEDLWFRSKENAEAHMASLINNGEVPKENVKLITDHEMPYLGYNYCVRIEREVIK